MPENMKIIGRKMAIRMGLLMSFCLSLVGTLLSGHFSFPAFIAAFILSTLISFLIGFLIPVGRISSSFCRKRNLQPGAFPTRCVEALISDVIYTPLITLAMTAFAYWGAMRQSGGMAEISFISMFLHSLLILFIIAFILIFIFMPIFMRNLMKKYGGQ